MYLEFLSVDCLWPPPIYHSRMPFLNSAKSRRVGNQRRIGFVTCKNENSMWEAIEGMKGQHLDGCNITVDEAWTHSCGRGGGGRGVSSVPAANVEFRCFVGGGLPWGAHDLWHEKIFSRFGEVIEAKAVMDRETLLCLGFGYVTFKNEQSRRDAIKRMNGRYEVDGRILTVKETLLCLECWFCLV